MSAAERGRAAYARIAEADRPEVWITLRPEADVLAEALAVDPSLPLAGLLLAVKDNIAVAGLPRTAACPAYAETSTEDAPAVARLRAAGAVVLGTTNLDQFATGLVGTRSPYGAVRSAHDPLLISGGSSSGSAVAVALGVADLALGTDTAGSGRVPAALQGIVGIKPTRGLVPVRGVVPACRTLDCVTVFARSVALAERAMAVMVGPDGLDPLSRPWPPDAPLAAPPDPLVGVPSPEALGVLDPAWRDAFAALVEELESTGVRTVTVDLEPFLAAGRLLYAGAFIAERSSAVGAFLKDHPDEVDPTVAALITPAAGIAAHTYVSDTALLDGLRLDAMAALGEADVLLLPTTTEHPTLAEVEAEPFSVNARLGTFTTFANLLDLCAVAVPAPGVGVSVIGRAFADHVVDDVARRIVGEEPGPATGTGIGLVVVGAHLRGLVLNHQLVERGARFVREVATASTYDLYALPTTPPKPGLVRRSSGGVSVAGELWELPPAGLASLLAELPPPMAFGTVLLDDGTQHVGFLVEPAAVEGATDISATGGWRAYLGQTA